MGEIIRGKDIALSIKEDIKKFVLERKEKNLAVPKDSINCCWKRWRINLLCK